MQDLDTEVVIATARGTNTNATAVSANVIVDERQMNALFLDVVTCYSPLPVSNILIIANCRCS